VELLAEQTEGPNMTHQSSKLGRAAQWGSIIGALAAVGACVLTFCVAYVVHPDFRVWTSGLAQRLGPLATGSIGVVVLGVLGLAVWRFWGLLIRPLRRLYRWVLWQLVVRPARDAFGVMAWREGKSGPLLSVGAVRVGLARLPLATVWVFRQMLGEGDEVGRGTLVWRPGAEVEYLGSQSAEQDLEFLKTACEYLERAGYLERWAVFWCEELLVNAELSYAVCEAGLATVQHWLDHVLEAYRIA
jgi:hypothetical protein